MKIIQRLAAAASLLIVTSAATGCGPAQADSNTPRVSRSNYVVKVFPAGDSIVLGVGSTWVGPGGGDVGWRQGVQDAAKAAGLPIFMVGPLSSGAALDDPFHEGIPGITIATIIGSGLPAARVGQFQPDIYIADAGTNDTPDGSAAMASRMSTWLDQIWAANTNPNLRIAVVEGLRRFDVPANVEIIAYNSLLPGIVAGKTFASRITIIHQYGALLDADYVGGSVHPNDAGYAKPVPVIWGGLAAPVSAVINSYN